MKIKVVTIHRNDEVLVETPGGPIEFGFVSNDDNAEAYASASEYEAGELLSTYMGPGFDRTDVRYETNVFTA